MPKIFISYRRDDAAGWAGRIFDRLSPSFGEENIFMDVANIKGGEDFVEILQKAVSNCDVLIAIIGRKWLNIADSSGRRRLDDPEDFVRIEIEAGLKRRLEKGIWVIPVLVDGASMPKQSDLPESLAAITRLNAIPLRLDQFNAGMTSLKGRLDECLTTQPLEIDAAQEDSVQRESCPVAADNRDVEQAQGTQSPSQPELAANLGEHRKPETKPLRPKNLEQFLAAQTGTMCAIYDLGGRSARILVGPITPPPTESFNQWSFWNAGILTEIGSELGPNRHLMVKKSLGLKKAVSFIRQNNSVLKKHGTSSDDIWVFATAPYRDMPNHLDVLSALEEQTRCNVNFLSPEGEAYRSACSVALTYNMGRSEEDFLEPGPNDVILVLDQGGDSLQVSYLFMTDLDKFVPKFFGALGTNPMHRKLMELGPSGSQVDPKYNNASVDEQVTRVSEYVRGALIGWDGYPELRQPQVRVHAYALGSAITKMFKGNNYALHNRRVSVDTIRAKTRTLCEDFGRRYKSIKVLNAAPPTGDLETNKLTSMVGLLAIDPIMDKLGVEELRICGYPLRYGCYIFQYCLGCGV